jgi:hypothetical protein
VASTPEGRVKNKVRRLLKQYPHLYFYWPVPQGFGASTVDCLICYHGVFIAIETKAPGKQPTKRQAVTIGEIANAGGHVFVIDGCTERLRTLLDSIRSAHI